MKKQALYILITAFIASIMLIPSAMAADSCCPPEEGTHIDQTRKIDQTSKVNGYQLEYEFINIKEKMKDMAEMGHSMGHTAATHHLMVYIKNAQGEPMVADQAGFLIKGPDGKEQKTMAMGMSGGHGADIDLSTPGEYTIKTKAVIGGGTTLLDAFGYPKE